MVTEDQGLRSALDSTISAFNEDCRERDEDRESWNKTAERMEELMKSLVRSRDEARAEVQRLKKRVVELEWGNEMACENTPYPECECPGCALARDRARRGVAGPEDE